MADEISFDDDFTISDEVRELAHAYEEELSELSMAFLLGAVSLGLTEVQGVGVVTHILIGTAAESACRARRELLGGEPEPERWKSVTEKAFARAVKKTPQNETAPETTCIAPEASP